MRETPSWAAASAKVWAASRSRGAKSGRSSIECTRYHAASTPESAERMSLSLETSPSTTSTSSAQARSATRTGGG